LRLPELRVPCSKVFGETACSGTSETSMATALAPVDSREVVRCDHCHLVQFRTNNNLCRKCRTSLDEDEPEPILEVQAPVEAPSNGHHSHLQVASAIRMLRQKSGLSQRQLALRMQASTASMCLSRLYDWVYSQSSSQAWFRSRLVWSIVIVLSRVLYRFSLFIHLFFTAVSGFYLNFFLTIVS